MQTLMKTNIITILLALSVLAIPAKAFEPAPHAPLERLEQGLGAGRPCNDDWKLLWEGYGAWYSGMTCEEFRDLIDGCRIKYWPNKGFSGSAFRTWRAQCIAYVGLGINVGGAMDYGWRGYKQAGFSRLGDEDIARAIQLARIFLGIPTAKRNPFKLEDSLNRVRQRWLKRRSNGKLTPADRRAAALEEAAERARFGP